jgi:hypothetical protein
VNAPLRPAGMTNYRAVGPARSSPPSWNNL